MSLQGSGTNERQVLDRSQWLLRAEAVARRGPGFGLTRLLGMAGDLSALMTLIRGIVAGDEAAVSRSLANWPRPGLVVP